MTERPGRPRLSPLAAAALLLVPLAATMGAPGAMAAATELRIDAPFLIEGQNYSVQGPITVVQGGILTVRNSTLLFELTEPGGITLTVHAGGALILEDARLLSNATGLRYNLLVSGILEAYRADIRDVRGDAGLGGIEIDGSGTYIEDSFIHHNGFYGLFIRSGAPVVRRTTFESNTVAISVLPGASPVLEDVTIRNSSSFGLKVADASPVVRNLTVLGSGNFAVGAVASVLDIEGCRITGGAVGIDAVQGTSGRVEGCEFLSLGTGVRAADSNFSVEHSTFYGSPVGVNMTRSPLEVTSNNFTDVDRGLVVGEAPAGASVGEAIGNQFAGTGLAIELHAANFFLEGNTYDTRMTGTRVFHEVTLLVVDAGGRAVRRAGVTITAADGTPVFSGLTNDTGAVVAVLEQFREYGNGTKLNLTPHGVRIEAGGVPTVTSVNATSDKTERITLGEAPGAGPGGLNREGLLLIGALFAVGAVAGALGLRARRQRSTRAKAARLETSRRRRGPRSGR